MPIYEYVCEGCGHHLEVMQKVSEAALVDCPACHKDRLRRIVSAPAFRLKGGGWYETDFKGKDGRRNLAGSGSTEKADSGKADTKPDGGATSTSAKGDTGTPKASASSGD